MVCDSTMSKEMRQKVRDAKDLLAMSDEAARGAVGAADPPVLQAHVRQLKACIGDLPSAEDIATLMGQEGRGSKAYFAILRAALRQRLGFEKRTRRPPKDAVNAMLSQLTIINRGVLVTPQHLCDLGQPEESPYA